MKLFTTIIVHEKEVKLNLYWKMCNYIIVKSAKVSLLRVYYQWGFLVWYP